MIGEHQRRGLARAAITRTLAALARQGVSRSFLMVYVTNAPAIRCYEALGFVAAAPPDSGQ